VENLAPTPEIRKSYEIAGRVAAQALQYGAKQIKPGANMREVLDSVEEYIRKRGCGIAFPAQSSISNVAAHFCPTDADEVIYKDGDVVKLDVGAHHEGYIGDTALTISIGGEHDELVRAAVAAVAAAQKALQPGCTPNDVGIAISEAIHSRGFKPVRNLSGHGVGRFKIHTSPGMPNYPTGEGKPLMEHQVVAIEPFATTGSAGLIYNGANPTLFSMNVARNMRTPSGKETLKVVQSYNGLPFTTRWLTRELGSKAMLGLTELRRSGVLHEYPPLLEKSGGLVAQRENTFMITKSGCKVLTTDED
jgi:methionyl aminopeptidase